MPAATTPSLGVATRALMAFVDEDQIVAFESFHRDGYATALLLGDQLGNLQHADCIGMRSSQTAFLNIESRTRDVRLGHLVKVLGGEVFVRSY